MFPTHLLLRIRRYVQPRENGQIIASKETIQLFKTEEGRASIPTAYSWNNMVSNVCDDGENDVWS